MPGSLLPSEAQLCEQHGVARGTVRAALAVLVGEGVAEVIPGVGRRVVGGTGTDRTTAYNRIAADISERIEGGEFSFDVALPSESVLMGQYGVSRNTVRRAYRVLRDSGVVVIRHGEGAFQVRR